MMAASMVKRCPMKRKPGITFSSPSSIGTELIWGAEITFVSA